MLEELQRKFVQVAMGAVTILILGMLGAVNIMNYMGNQTQMRRELERVLEIQHSPRELKIPQIKEPKKDFFRLAQHFIAVFDEEGTLLETDFSRALLLDETQAVTFAKKVFQEQREEGTIGNFRYYVMEPQAVGETKILFMDISLYRRANMRILGISVMIGILCWLGMFGLVRIHCKRAIRPIAENMERQRQFVTNAGHEIKTPLAIMQANAEALELHLGENKWTENIKGQIGRLDGLMKNLLMLAKMEETQVQYALCEIQAGQILERELLQYEEVAKQRGIVLEREFDKALTWKTNEEGFCRVVGILLENAVKYTNSQGKILVALKKERKLRLIVENTCDSLPKGDPEQLFERFYRGDEARNQKNGGYGIGLSMARSVLQGMNGVIYGEYLGKNGIRFTIEL